MGPTQNGMPGVGLHAFFAVDEDLILGKRAENFLCVPIAAGCDHRRDQGGPIGEP